MKLSLAPTGAQRLLAVVALLVVGTGCQRSFDSKSAYDHQACAETSMRRNAKTSDAEYGRAQFETSCRGGEMASCSALGIMHELGVEGPPSPTLAAKYYLRACEGGNPKACLNLGDLLVKNEGQGHDPVSAGLIFRDQCERGIQDACTRLGSLYLAGDGVSLQPLTAERLFNGACDAGKPDACVRLAEVASQRNDSRLADRMYARACKSGDIEACAHLKTTESTAELRATMVSAKTDDGVSVR